MRKSDRDLLEDMEKEAEESKVTGGDINMFSPNMNEEIKDTCEPKITIN